SALRVSASIIPSLLRDPLDRYTSTTCLGASYLTSKNRIALTTMIGLAESAPLDLELHAFSNTSERAFMDLLHSGHRFVVYQYAISVVLYSFRHPTRVHSSRTRNKAILMGLPWTLLTLLLGWWAFPSGPIFTIQCLITNLSGGVDVSSNILEYIRSQDPKYQYGLL